MEHDTNVNRVNHTLFSQVTHPQIIHVLIVPMMEQHDPCLPNGLRCKHVMQSTTGKSNYCVTGRLPSHVNLYLMIDGFCRWDLSAAPQQNR